MIDREHVKQALEVAAGSDDKYDREIWPREAVTRDRRERAARNFVTRFLDNVPEDSTAMELLEILRDDGS